MISYQKQLTFTDPSERYGGVRTTKAFSRMLQELTAEISGQGEVDPGV
jgi:hypothetical protein